MKKTIGRKLDISKKKCTELYGSAVKFTYHGGKTKKSIDFKRPILEHTPNKFLTKENHSDPSTTSK